MSKFKELYWDIVQGIGNFIKFRKSIWNYRDWDYSFLIDVNIELFDSMAEYYKDCAIIQDAEEKEHHVRKW